MRIAEYFERPRLRENAALLRESLDRYQWIEIASRRKLARQIVDTSNGKFGLCA